MDDFLEDALAKVLSPKRYLSWLQKKVESVRISFEKKGYLEKLVRYLDKIGQRSEAINNHFAGWIKRLHDSSPVCKKIAREVAGEIVQENPNKAFRRLFETIGVM